MKIVILSISVVLLLAGCSTTPIPMSKAKQAPPNRLLSFQEKRAETTSTIVVTRDAGIAGSACTWALSIDGKVSALLDAGETSRFYLSPGEKLLQVGPNPEGRGLCSAGNRNMEKNIETLLQPNETKYFRMFLIFDQGINIQRSSSD